MTAFRRVVVATLATLATLLAVWCFPALSLAKPAERAPAPTAAQASSTNPATSDQDTGSETDSLATREQKSRQLQDFKGGGVYIYLGSGALVVIVVVVLLVLLV